MAAYLGVSPSFILKKIKVGEIRPLKGGLLPLAEPGSVERERYRISRQEVRRVVQELPLPGSGLTLEERLMRLWKRLGGFPWLLMECRRVLDLNPSSEQHRKELLGLASRHTRKRRTPKKRPED